MSSTRTMQPNAHAMAGSTWRRSPSAIVRNPPPLTRDCASAIQLETIAHAQQPECAEADGGRQHHPLEQRLPQWLDVEHEEQIADRAKHERPENCADRAAGTAEQRYAAEDHRGNRIQRI